MRYLTFSGHGVFLHNINRLIKWLLHDNSYSYSDVGRRATALDVFLIFMFNLSLTSDHENIGSVGLHVLHKDGFRN